jgi:hypothetical protein
MKTKIEITTSEAINRVVQHIKDVTEDLIDCRLQDLNTSAANGDWDEVVVTAQEIKSYVTMRDECIKKVSNISWVGDLIPTIISDVDLYGMYFMEDSLHAIGVAFGMDFIVDSLPGGDQ